MTMQETIPNNLANSTKGFRHHPTASSPPNFASETAVTTFNFQTSISQLLFRIIKFGS